MSFIFAVTIRENMKAARSPPRLEPAKGNDFRPRATPRSALSAALLVTSNRATGEWGTFFGDAVVATATLDRMLHHGHEFYSGLHDKPQLSSTSARARETSTWRTVSLISPKPRTCAFRQRVPAEVFMKCPRTL